MKRAKNIKKSARAGAYIRQGRAMGRSFLKTRNFSDVEDDADSYNIIRRLAADAGSYAAAEARAAGLSRAYVRNNQLVKVSAEGSIKHLSPKISRTSFYVKFKPATVLHAVKK